jgi:hypothetical protein
MVPIKIDYNSSAKSYLSLKSINNEIFDNLFNDSYCEKIEQCIENDKNDIIEHDIDIDCNNTTNSSLT